MRTILFAAAAGCALMAMGGERTALFNGRDLTGWTPVADAKVTGGYAASEPTWFVADGAIRTTGTPFGYLRTARTDYADYLLHVEYRWWRKTEKPNSGVFVRLAKEHGSFIPTCVENQLCIGSVCDVLGLGGFRIGEAKPRNAFDPSVPLSGITRAARRGASTEKPFGEWNTIEVELKGDTLVNRLNGVELNRVTGISVAKGAIALQSEGGAAEFRNVWIEERPAGAASPTGLGEVRVKGYVGERLDLMLKNHLAATDTDYITAPFREKTERRGWWQTEFWGKYMHAAVPFRPYARDARLDANIEKGLDAILASQEPSGYIGNYPEDIRCGEGWDVWGMKYTMLGLMHYFDGAPTSEKGKRALAAACRVCDYLIGELGPNGKRGKRLYQTGNWCGFASSSVLEPVVWLYNRTHEKRYLDFATYLVADMTEREDGPRLLDLALKGISVADRNGYGNKPEHGDHYVMKRNRRKAYEMMSCYQGLVAYALATGRKDLLDAAKATGEQIVRDEINVAGGSASSEAWFHGATKQHLPYTRLQETCVVTTWMRFCETLLAVTHDTKWADELEKSFYNVYLASLNRTADEFAAYTPLNGSRYRGHHHCYMHTNCCNANGPRGFLSFLRALVAGEGDTAYLNFYVSGSAAAVLPKTGEKVSFEGYATYPKTGYVRLVNHTPKTGAFTLALRIPGWSEKTRVRINGKDVGEPVKAGGYCRLARTWTIGDIVEIDFDMHTRIHRLDHAVAFTRGPIALARDTRFGDGPIDEVLRVNWERKVPAPNFEPTRCPDENVWMAFAASLPLGSHHENPEGANPSTVRFCDYASAADLWEPANAARVWLPCEYGPEE